MRNLLKEDTTTSDSCRLLGSSAGTSAGRHLRMFQYLIPASGNLPKVRLSSFSAHEKSFKQERQKL